MGTVSFTKSSISGNTAPCALASAAFNSNNPIPVDRFLESITEMDTPGSCSEASNAFCTVDDKAEDKPM